MYPIVRKEKLADNIILMDIKAPRVAKECLPGQFIIAKTDEVGERIPLTICDYDREKETVTIVVQTIGAGTERMMALNEGDSLEDFVGPLGCPSELCQEDNLEETKKKHIVFIAGGLGTAPVYPQVKWLKEHGVDADVIMGFRNKDIQLNSSDRGQSCLVNICGNAEFGIAKNLSNTVKQLLLGLILRFHDLFHFSLWQWKGFFVYLLILVQRNLVDLHGNCRNHVWRLGFFDEII